MPSNHLILCCPLVLLPSIFPSIRVFSNEVAKVLEFHMRWPKYWSFSFSISPSNEHPGLISFRMNWLDLLAVQGTLKSLLQHHSSKASILRRSAFFIVQLSHSYMTTGKTIALTRWTFVDKVIRHLLISCLQSPSAVILEPKKIKSVTVSIVSPSICHEVMGLDAMILVSEYWVVSPLFHSPLSSSSRESFVSLCLLPLGWYYLHIWDCWHFSQQPWFQLVIHPAWHFAWCTLHRSSISRVTICSLDVLFFQFGMSLLFHVWF